jgi:hypothetical protein
VAARYLRFELHGAAEPRRAPWLERLLARAADAPADPDWRADALRIIAPQTPLPPVAAVAYCAAHGPRRQGSVFLATPLHYLAEISNVRLAEQGILSLDAAEAESLARDFNRDWVDAGVDLWAAAGRLFCGFDAPLEASTHDPEPMRGRHLEDFLPGGAHGRRLRSLMSEIEMWLFEHAVNQARRQRAQLPLSALWLWGGGAPLAALPAVQGSAAGGDVLFDAYAPAQGETADIMRLHAGPNSPEWSEMQSRWLEPTLAALQSRRLERLELSAGARRLVIDARWRRRFWRRAKPWWEYFE